MAKPPTLPNPEIVPEEADTIRIHEYADWVKYEHSKHTKENKPDEEWYNKRVAWISSIQRMKEQAKQATEEKDLQGERIIFIADI